MEPDKEQLSKLDVEAWRKADRLVVRFAKGAGEVELIKEADRAVAFSEDRRHRCPASVWVRNVGGWSAIAPEVLAEVQCYGGGGFYRGQGTVLETVAKLLRVGDVLEFNFQADAHTSGYLAAAGLHGDALKLTIHRGEDKRQRLDFEIDCSITRGGPHSGRMVRGLPVGEWYYESAKRTREAA